MHSVTTFVEAVDKHRIFIRLWQPDRTEDQALKGVVHILHGMAEHSYRYTTTAEHLTQEGYVVVAHDHRGHGFSVIQEKDLGHYSDSHGWQLVLSDVTSVQRHIREQFPSLPLFALGHSMGSFILEAHLIQEPQYLAGVILSGAAKVPRLQAQTLNLVARIEKTRLGSRATSRVIERFTIQNYHNAFAQPCQWLSKEADIVEGYLNDPKCGFPLTVESWLALSDGLKQIHSKGAFNKLPTHLPFYLFGGDQDPVGNKGKALTKLIRTLEEAGVSDIEHHIYQGGRHEMLNESNKLEVLENLTDWLHRQVNKPFAASNPVMEKSVAL